MTYRKFPVKRAIAISFVILFSSCAHYVGANELTTNSSDSNANAETVPAHVNQSSIQARRLVPFVANGSFVDPVPIPNGANSSALDAKANESEVLKSSPGNVLPLSGESTATKTRLDKIIAKPETDYFGKLRYVEDFADNENRKPFDLSRGSSSIQWKRHDTMESYGSWATKFQVVVILLIVLLVAYRYRRKIIALILEGRRPAPGDRRSNVRYSILTETGNA
uniref:Uncharacterized protein n=1 Tax=Trichuris muris TaxID=70415 RepID=A0A5S6R3R6_TRIMR